MLVGAPWGDAHRNLIVHGKLVPLPRLDKCPYLTKVLGYAGDPDSRDSHGKLGGKVAADPHEFAIVQARRGLATCIKVSGGASLSLHRQNSGPDGSQDRLGFVVLSLGAAELGKIAEDVGPEGTCRPESLFHDGQGATKQSLRPAVLTTSQVD
jgi:hypothetical protein